MDADDLVAHVWIRWGLVGERFGDAAYLEAADVPRIEGHDVVDDEGDFSVSDYVVELSRVAQVTAVNVDRARVVVDVKADRTVLQRPIGRERRQPPKALRTQVLELP